MAAATYKIENVYFGAKVGELPVLQLGVSDHYQACLTRNELLSDGDNTGMRVYMAAHILIRFFVQQKEILKDSYICELGCGTGIVSLSCIKFSEALSALVTDGSKNAVELAQANIQSLGLQSRVAASQLVWGQEQQQIPTLIGSFDIVLASDLVYYNTDVLLLTSTARSLLKKEGLFIHSHHFRQLDSVARLVECLSSAGWQTAEAPLNSFVDASELQQHVDWNNAKCLISGPPNVIECLMSENLLWRIFGVEEEEEKDTGTELDHDDEEHFGGTFGELFGG